MALNSKYRRFDNVLVGIIQAATAVLLMTMFVVIMMEVIFRYVLTSSPFWTEELARYVMFYMVLMGSVVAIREERHPALTFIVQKFPVRFRRVWNLLIDGLVFFVLIFVLREGYRMAVDEWIGKTTALRIPFFWVYLALPVGAFLMMVQIVAKHILGKKAFNKNGKSVSVSKEG
jgi:TRAP-type C4-dicarboxylate transport system permease small subunit